MFVRSFSLTNIKCAGKALTYADKTKLKSYGMEFAKTNPVPVIAEADKIKSEKAVDLAAAFEKDPEGLKARKEEVRSAFSEATGEFGSYFEKNKFEYAKKELDKDKRERNKEPVAREDVDAYMEKSYRDPYRLDAKKLNVDNKGFFNLSKEAYQTMKDSVDTHTKAERLIEKMDPSVKEGNPENIDKDFFRKDLTVTFPEAKPENSSSESKAENSSEAKAENSSKRSFEEAGESSNDSANKRAKTENNSAVDYVLEKQNSEMPDIYESDGE